MKGRNYAAGREKIAALTFDDGPNTSITPLVLEKLLKYNIIGSFFAVGSNINSESEQIMKNVFRAGCEIGNHSFAHADMTKLTAEEIKKDIAETSRRIAAFTGSFPAFFRPPYIAVNDIMFENTDLPFIAGIGANDWESEVSAEERARLILDQVKDGDIILLHDMENNYATVEALDIIIPEMLGRGFGFATVSQLFEAKGIQPRRGIVYSNALQTSIY
ncbi:polysaccharide deacetylase family protein [Ruminococcus sp. Marseille-P6503]|uniref:polysaccharide deacetylase family protein n=1 Tax=Ruminococcus sp. Marseille-P6503 TaxID=2364796 RepID=UPI000F53C6A1|nr:polysaccharide deacetylase family protein [Ruminococcus sp. Marseille-P6503]